MIAMIGDKMYLFAKCLLDFVATDFNNVSPTVAVMLTACTAFFSSFFTPRELSKNILAQLFFHTIVVRRFCDLDRKIYGQCAKSQRPR